MQNPSVSIELLPTEAADLDEITALCLDAGRRTPDSGWDENYPNREVLQKDIESGGFYKVVQNGRIVSVMLIRSWENFCKDEVAEDHSDWSKEGRNPCALGRFCVSPDLQGQGLGRRIMLASLEKARSLGYDSARFHTLDTDRIACHLYDSMGFRRTGSIDEYGLIFICYEILL